MTDKSPPRQEFRGIRSNSFDDTPRRTRSDAPVFKFPATAIWNNILTCFINEGPRLRHRRQFTYVDDSFTGKEAVDFLMTEIPKVFLNGRAVTRKNCTDLLQKFLEKKVFSRYKVLKTSNQEHEVIKDNNTLYVHNRKNTVCRTPLLMLDRTSDNQASDEETAIGRGRRSSSFRQSAISTTHSPSTTPNDTSWNRRASMSHGNLSVIIPKPDENKEEYAEIQKTPACVIERHFSSPSPTFMEGRRTSLSSGHVFHSLVAPRLSMSGTMNNQRPSRLRKQTQDDTSLSSLRLAHRLNVGCSDANVVDNPYERKDSGETENIYDFLPFFKRKKKPVEKDVSEAHVRSRSRNGRMPLAEVNGTETVQLKSVTKHQEFHSGRKQGRKRMVARRVLSGDESAIIWKACLLSRLKRLLNSSDFTFLSWNIDGTNIRTNSGSAKSVRFAAERGGYSSYLTRMMHHLEEFPFTSSNTNVIVVRDNQEVQIFETLCSNLEAEGSVLTGNEASALLHIVAHIHEVHKAFSQARRRNALPRGKIQTSAVSSNLAGSRTSCSSMSTYLSDLSDIHLPGLKLNNIPEGTQVAFRPNGDAVSDMSSPEFSECSSVVSFENRRRSDRLLQDRLEISDVYALPGFKRSPDVPNNRNQVSFTPNLPDIIGHHENASPQYLTTSERADKNPMTENLSDEELNNLLVAFSLVLLTFPLQTRNKLYELIRFLSKVSRNHCLQLSPIQENRYVLLQRLVVPCIIPENSPLTAPQAINLVALLMDNERLVFSVDEILQTEVNARSDETANGQIYLTDQDSLNNAPTPERNVVQYCQPIERTDYCTQSGKINDYLLPLLDSIIHADMKESERDKKLKVFRKAHPEVYSVRFPAAKEKEHNGGFLKRLFSDNGTLNPQQPAAANVQGSKAVVPMKVSAPAKPATPGPATSCIAGPKIAGPNVNPNSATPAAEKKPNLDRKSATVVRKKTSKEIKDPDDENIKTEFEEIAAPVRPAKSRSSSNYVQNKGQKPLEIREKCDTQFESEPSRTETDKVR